MSSLCLMLIKSSWLNSGLELATLTIIHKLMSRPFHLFRALPKVYGISVIFAEEGSDPSGEWYDNLLKGINLGFKDFTGCSDRISDNNDIMGVVIVHGRDKTNIYSH